MGTNKIDSGICNTPSPNLLSHRGEGKGEGIFPRGEEVEGGKRGICDFRHDGEK